MLDVLEEYDAGEQASITLNRMRRCMGATRV
jgi:hypothetical protein